jgi:lipopolysaccharide heptosyltransferase II
MNNKKKSILIVLVAGIGDIVLGSPGLRAIRNGYPSAEIHLLTNAVAEQTSANYPYVDRVWTFPIRSIGSGRGVLEAAKCVFALRRRKFDVILNLYGVSSRAGALKMGLLFVAVGAKERIGHDNKGFGLFLTKKIPKDTFFTQHSAEAMLAAAEFAGGIPDGKGIEIFWDKATEKKWSHLFPDGETDADAPRIGIFPGGNLPHRRWESEKFALLADRLIETYGARIYVFGGPVELQISAYILGRMKHGATDLSGKLDLNGLAYAASRLDLMIANDSGPMHVAAAAGAPLVAIFGPQKPELFRPYVPEERYSIVRSQLDCVPCTKLECDHLSCMKDLSVETVFDAAAKMLR